MEQEQKNGEIVLALIVFLAGAVLMSLEMIGSRILAPSFGTSVYVWGALIGMVMTALTCGYFLGGRAADRWPHLSAMGIILAAAGAAIGFMPLWMDRITQSLRGLGPRTGSLAAAFVLFFLPSLLLATVSPYGIKLAGRSLGRLGGTAGRISALSSAGSILGTLATSFFLIPALGVRSIARLLGVILFVLAGLTLLPGRKDDQKRGRLLFPLLLLLGGTAVFLAPLPPSGGCMGMARILYERDTLYHHLVVDQIGEERHLHFDRSWQSAMDLRDPLRMVFGYTSALHLGVVARPRPRRVLFIGLGAGSATRRFLHDYPSLVQVDVVEIDPEVVKVARRYFLLPSDPRLRVFVEDGRLFVDRRAEEVRTGRASPYDMVILDAFFSDAIPYHLTTREFLASLRGVLRNDGVVVANLIGAPAGRESRFVQAMAKTFAAVFPEIYLFPLGFRSESITNVILIAPGRRLGWDAATWQAEANRCLAEGIVREEITAYASMLFVDAWIRNPAALTGIPLLTDDFAPVDTLQSPF